MSQSNQSAILMKYDKEPDYNKAILLKMVEYYRIKKMLLLNLEKGLYGFAVIDRNIIAYEKEDLKYYTKEPYKFKELIYNESLKLASYHFIKNQLEKNDAKNKLSDTKYRLSEKNALNKTINIIMKALNKTEKGVRISAYEYYNRNYNETIDINNKQLFNDIKVISIYAIYLNMNINWSADDIDELTENIPNDN